MVIAGSKLQASEIDVDARNAQKGSASANYSNLQFTDYDASQHSYWIANYDESFKSDVFSDRGVWHTVDVPVNTLSDGTGTLFFRGTNRGTWVYDQGGYTQNVSTPFVIGKFIVAYSSKPSWAPTRTATTISFDKTTGAVDESLTPNASSGKEVFILSIVDPTIAKEENGKLVLLKEGTTKVKVAVAGTATHDGWVQEFDINVDAAVVAVTGVTLDKNELSLAPGAEATLVATVTPEDATDKTVTWSSSDNDVATVDENGKVKAGTKEGTATITASAGGHTATATVYVADYSWLQEVAIAIEGTTAKVVGPDQSVAKFTKFYVGSTPVDGNSADISTATDGTELKATTDDGAVVKLKYKK